MFRIPKEISSWISDTFDKKLENWKSLCKIFDEEWLESFWARNKGVTESGAPSNTPAAPSMEPKNALVSVHKT